MESILEKNSKGNLKWVRSGKGNKTTGEYHWEYAKDGKYYAQGFYHTPEEAYEACLKHQGIKENVYLDS
jgi:hypothetical protein